MSLDNLDAWKEDPYIYPDEAEECPYCGDDGEAPDPECWACDGRGWLWASELDQYAADDAASWREDELREEEWYNGLYPKD